jgi:hypothetical protein
MHFENQNTNASAMPHLELLTMRLNPLEANARRG